MKKLLPLLKNLLTKDIRSFFVALIILVLISISGRSQAQVYYLTSDETGGTNATTDALNRMNYDGSSNTVMVPSFSNSPVAIAQDLANNRLFIYDGLAATKSIKIVTASTGVITGSIPVPFTLNSMRYDAATDYIYFITTNTAISTDVSDALYRVKSTDSAPTLIKASITPSPLYLALDIPNDRVFIYESTGGSSRGIKTYNLSSNTFTQTATINSGTVKDIAYDPLTDYLYYLTSDDIATSTAATDALNKVQPGGSTTTVIKAAVTASPSQCIVLDAGNNRAYIYEGVTANRAIKAVNLTTGDVSTVISLSSLTAGVTVKSLAVPLIPVLSTVGASGITSASATLGGNVTKSDVSVLERGVVYSSTNTTPVIGNGTKAANGTGTGSFSQSISGLSGSTTYYVRSYATSGAGTAYGAVISFSTPSNDANLSGFTISAGTLTPSFSAGTVSYTASVANSNSTFTVTPTKNNANASIKVNNVAVTSGTASASIGLNVGSNTITTIVTAQDGTTTKTYTTTVTRDKAAQTITFNALPAKNYGNADFAPGATASSGLGVSYSSDNTAVATIVSGNIHIVGIGTANITASQSGDANTLAASNVSQALTVNKAAVTVTATAQTKVYGNADPTFTYSITSGALVGSDAFTGALSRDAGKNIGLYPITQNTLSLNSNYTLSFVSANLTITKRPITFAPSPATKVYGNGETGYPFSIIGTLAAGNVTGDSFTREPGETVGVYALSLGNKKIIDPTNGNEIVNNNYDITFVPTTLTITKRVIVLKPEPATKIYGNADPGYPYQFVTGSVAPADGMTGTFGRAPGENIGAYALTLGTKRPVNASTGNDTGDNYDISFVSIDLTITPKIVSVFANAQSKSYGDADSQLTTFISGSLVGSDALTGSLTREAGENAGTYAITQGTLALSSNYSYTFTGNGFTINKRPVNVTANAKSKTFGDADPAFTFTAPTLPNGESFTGQLTRPVGEAFGTYPITQGTLALSDNYILNYTAADLSISKKSINITANAQSKTYGNADPVLTYTAGALLGGDTFSGELSRETGNGFGTYAITQGTLAANTNYSLNYTGANLSISKGTLTYVADHVTRQFQTANPTFTGSVTGFANGENIASTTTGTLSFTSAATTSSARGSYDITGSGLSAANYNFVQDATNGSALTIVASADATLAALTATQGSITPAFSGNETNYSFAVANGVTSFDLSATVNSAYATMMINGQAFTSGSTKTYTLTPGYNEFNIIVTAQDETTKAYRLGINRAYSANNLLSSISLSAITISPAFNTNTLGYTASVGNLVTSTDVYGVPVDNTATLTINGNPATAASPVNISLGVGENPISIVSKAQDGTDRVYVVVVTRAQSPNATLASLGNSQLTLNTPFVAGTHSYTATVPTNVSALYFMPVPSNDRATVTVNGQPLNIFSGNYMPIGFSDNALTVDVTSEDGTGHIIYTVAITRVKSADATLAVLNIPFETTINEPFDPNTYAYTATVTDSTYTGLPLTATSADENAVVKINGTVVPRFQNYIMAIHGGANTFNIVVASQDGSAAKTYTLVLTRAGQAPPLLSPVANLFALNVSSGSTFSKNFNFSIGEELTTIYAPNNIASVRIFTVSENQVSTVTVNGVTLPYDTSTDLLPISVGDNLFTIVVTAEDGAHTKTYDVHVNRLPFADVTLASLVLNKGTLTPNFTSATTSYTASVKNSVSTINVTPVAAAPGVTIAVNNIAVDAAHPTATINVLAGPPTRIRTIVTAADGINTKTYTVNVTRLAPQPTLASLTLSAGTLSPAFDEDVFAYTTTVTNATTGLMLTPTLSDTTARVKVNGIAVNNGTASVSMPIYVGVNTITTVVTAQDGADSRTYTMQITRAGSSSTLITGAPVETAPKAAPDQIPAFAGQTRIGSVHTTTPLKVTTITSGLKFPWDLVFLPDGRMMVTEKAGTIRIVTKQGAVGEAITGVPAVKYQTDSGLLALILDPDFATTRLVFWTFVEPVTGGYVTSVARGRLSNDESSFENVTVIYRATPAYNGVQHPGSRMVFDAQGRLYVCIGEHFDDVIRTQAQDLNSSIGKIIRINKDGTAAAGNPYSGTTGARSEIWSLGHRDPQGMAFNPITGDLWESDHGPAGGDEINLINSGANYGWPTISYGVEYNGPRIGLTVGNGTQQVGMAQPKYYWDPAIAPSGITFYTGSLIPEWNNNLFIAALKGKHIVRLVIENNVVVGEERLLTAENQRFRSVVQGPDGALYAITDQTQGKIYRISNISTNASLASLIPSIGTLSPLFKKDSLNYKTTVTNATTSLRLTPTLSDTTAIVKVNGTTVRSGSASSAIQLNIGVNVINILVTAEDGTTTKHYTLTVNRQKSNNAWLSNIVLNPNASITQVPGTADLNYITSVNNTTASITITPTTAEANATIKVNGVSVISGTASTAIPLSTGPTVIAMEVTAQDGVTKHSYSITVNKTGSSNAWLSNIVLNPNAAITQVPGTADLNYITSVSNTTASITVTPTTAEANATIKVNGISVISGTASTAIPLSTGPTVIAMEVTAQDGMTKHSYSIIVNKTGSSNAWLSNIILNPNAAITQVPGTADLNYVTSVNSATASITVTPTATEAHASIKVNGVSVTSGTASAAITLDSKPTVILMEVTAQDGVTKHTYSITVSKTGSSNAWLSNIVLNPNASIAQVPGTADLNYVTSVSNTATSITVKPTTMDANATVKVNGVAVVSGTASAAILLTTNSTVITMQVTAQDGVTKHSYSITVNKTGVGATSITSNIQKLNPESFNIPSELQAIVVHQGLSPNGDGVNDFLNIEGIGQYRDNQVMVMNRSGDVIYTAKGYNNSSVVFDGHASNGKLQLPGTYFYSLDYKQGKETKRKTGYIVIKY